MPIGDSIFGDILTALEKYVGVRDDTLAEYIINLGKQGEQAIKLELKEFPPKFVDRTLSILGFNIQEPRKPFTKTTTEAIISEIRQDGVVVRIDDPKLRLQKTGFIHKSQIRSGRSHKQGDKVQVQLKSSNNASDFELTLIGEKQKQSTSISGDEFELQQLQAASGAQNATLDSNTARKRAAKPELVVTRKIPAFLENEKLGDSFHDPTSHEDRQHWLDKAAQHTSSKVPEASFSNASQGSDSNHKAPPGVRDRMNKGKQPPRAVSKMRPTLKKKELPVHAFRLEILQSLAESPIIIVVGDTGSGKTTQIAQFLHEAGYSRNNKLIACTQPRRIAAISIAQRVAEEMEAGRVGGTVGYSVRFDDCTSKQTAVKYMTDGLLQREIISDPDLSSYSVIMLDEAHERTVATDVLFSLLKSAVARRPDLRVIVTSATLDAAKFGTYFGGAPILRIPGRMHPVTVEWAEEPVLDYMEAALSTVKRIHETNKVQGESGDILVFLTGQAEIDMATSAIAEAYPKNDLIPIPVYAAIPNEMQSLIFDPAPPGKRKVVFATNIAETSLTIDGIKFVVDCGFSKVQTWDARKGMGVLRVRPISQAQANQRLGRAGRTAPGVCYRLYTKHSFDTEMSPSTIPEIQRDNLGNTTLLLKAMGINDLLNFDFMDPPPRASLASSMHELYVLGAIDENGNITSLGMSMATYPLDPSLAKVLITAKQIGSECLEDILTIISMMSMPSVFYRPSQPAGKKIDADNAHRKLQDITGDHLTLLKVFNNWRDAGFNKKWCDAHYLQYKNLLKVKDARRQLADLVYKDRGRRSDQNAKHSSKDMPQGFAKERRQRALKALCSGYFQNIAKCDGRGPSNGGAEYTTLVGDTRVNIHPSSVLYRQNTEYVLYSTLIMTSKEYMHTISEVQPEWLVEAAPEFFREADLEDIRKKQRSGSLKPLFQRHAAHENEWRVSEQRKSIMTRKRR